MCWEGANRQVRKRSAPQNMLMVKHENGVFFDLEISTLSRLSYRSTAGSENGVFPYLAVDLSLCKKFALTMFKAFPLAALCQTARPCTVCIPPSPTTPLTGAYAHFTPPRTSKPPNCVYNSGVCDVLRVGAFAVVCLLLAAVLALASTLAHVVLLYPKPGCVNRQQPYRDNLIVLSVCRSNRQPNRRVQHRWSRDWVRRLRGCGRGRGSCGA